MMAHLTKLQEIADAHDGNRALGTAGYDASVDYVANALRDKGFDVQTPEFEVRLPFAEDPQLTVGGATIEAKPLQFTIGTPDEGVSGPLVAARVDDSPGCTASDYDGLPVKGAVVLVDRGTCQFSQKQAVGRRARRGRADRRQQRGRRRDGRHARREDATRRSRSSASPRPRVSGCAARPATTTLKLKAGVRVEKTRNVIAQTKTGSTADVVMVGAHLDSVPEGPGINDNGSGVAAVLETALQLGPSPQVQNAVRFGFWGAEELGLKGSDNYVESLDVDQLKDIALYLNFDMLGSPNPGYFTYDGDQSAPPNPREANPRVPEGSAGIERNFVAYLEGCGEDRAGHVVRRPLRLRRLHQGGSSRGRSVLRRRGEDDPANRPSCGTARRTSRSTRTTTRRPTPWTTSIADALEINGAGRRLRRRHLRAGSARPQRRADPRRPHPARTDRVMTPAVGARCGDIGWRVRQSSSPCCSAGARRRPRRPQDLARDLADKVGVDGMYVHLRKLQEIADANNGSRAEGTPGYDASVDYVAQTLRDKGFDVQTPGVRAARRGVAGKADAHRVRPRLPRRPGVAADADPGRRVERRHAAPAEACGLCRRRLRDEEDDGRHRRRRRHRLLGRRQAEHRRRRGRRRASRRQRSRRERAARRGCSRRATTRG